MLCVEGDTFAEVTHGLTLGVDAIVASKTVLVLVTGAHKQVPLHEMLHSTPSPQLPATLLRTHPGAHVLCDKAATTPAVAAEAEESSA
jgi:6-phosphogluconolactonase/glucosamine-6-phosphate isomerase/deaminase